MKGLFKKISYLVVLMAMTLFMGMRSMPHHHCCITTGASAPLHAVHFGIDDCNGCDHNHDNEEEHSHCDIHCFIDSHFFLRLTDDSPIAEKKTYNVQPALILQEAELPLHTHQIVHLDSGGFYRYLSRDVQPHSLRAPPATCL